jgi:phospholipid/cholesterol/gamma-HCH transport system substrate-binding protein
MTDRGTRVAVGVTVLIALMLGLAGVIWLGQYSSLRGRRVITVRFSDVSGLETGDPVTVAGVNKGKVVDIVLSGRQVFVDLLIDDDVWFAQDATFTIRSKSALGERYISADLGTSPHPLNLDGPIAGAMAGDLSDATEQLGELASRLGNVLGSLERNVLNDEALASIRETLVNLETATGDLAAMAAENRRDLKLAMTNIKGASKHLQEAASGLDNLVNNNEAVVTEAISRLSNVAGRLDTLTAGLDEGEGTLGMLLKDEALYTSLQSAVDELNALIQDIQENPGRYIHVSVF